MVTNRESRSRSAKKKVAAKPLKADRVPPANGNGASSSNHDVLRRMYVSMLRCRMLTERAQYLLSRSTPTTDCGVRHRSRSYRRRRHAGAGSGRRGCRISPQHSRPDREGGLAGICGIADGAGEPKSPQSSRTDIHWRIWLLLIRSTSGQVSRWPKGWRRSATWSSLWAPTTFPLAIAGMRP